MARGAKDTHRPGWRGLRWSAGEPQGETERVGAGCRAVEFMLLVRLIVMGTGTNCSLTFILC